MWDMGGKLKSFIFYPQIPNGELRNVVGKIFFPNLLPYLRKFMNTETGVSRAP